MALLQPIGSKHMTRLSSLILVFLFIIPQASRAQEKLKPNKFHIIYDYSWERFWGNIKAPVEVKSSKHLLIAGSLLTATLLGLRESTIDPLQENWSQNKPLGDSSKYGDISGQMLPNGLYALGMYLHGKTTNNNLSHYRAMYMLEASLYSGLTTAVLKTIVGERRPNNGDTRSFPSGHTTTAFAFATAVFMEHDWQYFVPAFALATFVGVSRINDNKHYLHDVVAGATIGSAYAVAIAKKNNSLIEKYKGNVFLLPTKKLDGIQLAYTFQF